MKKFAFFVPLILAALPAFGGYPKHHTDGIEPYTLVPQFKEYIDKLPPETRKAVFASEKDMQWWLDAKFGVFVHWGPSSMLKCSMSWGRKGPRPRHPSDGTVTKGIPQEIYDNQYKQLAVPNFDADEWIKMVRDSGAKYFIFTAKHHDGFCNWDTKLTDYNIMHTPFGRDILKELTDACHKYGIRVAIYYSQPDWNEPLYTKDLERYRKEFLFPQIRELMTNYGKIDVMWFDGLGMHPDTWNAPELIKMIRKLQPGIIVNHRWAWPVWHAGDFDGPERSIGRFQTNRPWETCTVIGGGWAWSGDAPAMPLPQAIRLLVRCVGNGGNLALGAGPTGAGEFLPDHKKRFLEMGRWLKKYGESIYGTRAGPYVSGPWGASTFKDNTVYLHLLADWSGKISLPALPAEIVGARLLAGGTVKAVQRDGKLRIEMDPKDIHPLDTIIALELDRPAKGIKLIQTVGTPWTIGAKAAASSERSPEKGARCVIASDLKEFSEGIFVKNAWMPDGKDKTPWIALELEKPVPVSQIQIREGRFGQTGNVQSFVIEARTGGDWKPVHSGTRIGGDFGLVLPEPVTSDAFRIRLIKWKGTPRINSFDVFR